VSEMKDRYKLLQQPNKLHLWRKNLGVIAIAVVVCMALISIIACKTDRSSELPNNKIWNDSKTGLMWTKHDNGSEVNFYEARSYCANLHLGGYSDWQLPSIDELQGIYNMNVGMATATFEGEKTLYSIKGGIVLTWPWEWSSTGIAPQMVKDFRFDGGMRFSSYPETRLGHHALCIRDSGK